MYICIYIPIQDYIHIVWGTNMLYGKSTYIIQHYTIQTSSNTRLFTVLQDISPRLYSVTTQKPKFNLYINFYTKYIGN